MINPHDDWPPVEDVDWPTTLKIAFWAGLITLVLGLIYITASS